MKLRYLRLYRDFNRLNQDFNKVLTELYKSPYYKEEDYKISLANASIECETHCTHFRVADKFNFMGMEIDYVYFDEFAKFDGQLINNTLEKVYRSSVKRFTK